MNESNPLRGTDDPNQYQDCFGRVYVEKQMLDEYPTAVAGMMKGLVVVKAEMDYRRNAMEYIAMAPCFRNCVREQIPIYVPRVFVVSQLIDWTFQYETRWTEVKHDDYQTRYIVTTEHFVTANFNCNSIAASREELLEEITKSMRVPGELLVSRWNGGGGGGDSKHVIFLDEAQHFEGGGGGEAKNVQVPEPEPDTWEAISKKYKK